MTKRTEKKNKPKEIHLSRARLDELLAETVVDAIGESEQATGFYTMLENDLKLPFETQILGVTATVERVNGRLIPHIVPVYANSQHMLYDMYNDMRGSNGTRPRTGPTSENTGSISSKRKKCFVALFLFGRILMRNMARSDGLELG